MRTIALMATGLVFLLGSNPIIHAADQRPAEQPLVAKPFDLSAVRLTGGPLKDKLEANRKYLLSLDADRLLHVFRLNAKLPTTAQPLGGWEKPDGELRGHFVGHYLSGCALMYQATGDAEIKARADKIVTALAECQQALGGEYCSAFPESFFDRLEAGQKVWAPYYTIHKIMAGLLDVNQAWGNAQALEVLKGMGRYFAKRNAKLSEQQMRVVWRNEFGGMMEVAYNLYAVTGDEQFKQLGEKFNQGPFFDPLAKRTDNLMRLHANTQIPKVIGAARAYELSGDARFRTIGEFFWDQVALHRSFSTGGTSTREHWRTPPDRLASELEFDTQETCCTYNMLKLTRQLFAWDPQPKYADYYERAYVNSIWPSIDTPTGMVTYFLSLRPGGYKLYSTPTDSFWCCNGTGVETWSKIADSVYFHDADSIYVNLFVPTELTWKDRGITVRQETEFPRGSSTTLTITVQKPTEVTLKLRIPWWTASGAELQVNGRPSDATITPGAYTSITRTWSDGDRIELKLPMRLHLESMPDDPAVAAVMYGPLVLAGRLGSENLKREDQFKPDQLMYTQGDIEVPSLLIDGPGDLAAAVAPVNGRPLEFTARTAAGPIALAPIDAVNDERYTVYWQLASAKSDAPRQWADAQAAKAAYKARLVDEVKTGDQTSERAHRQQGTRTTSGVYKGRRWRDAAGWFSYDLAVTPETPLALACTFSGDDTGRNFDILIDGKKLTAVSLERSKPGGFNIVEYPLPPELLQGKQKITVRFESHPNSTAGGLFGCAILKS